MNSYLLSFKYCSSMWSAREYGYEWIFYSLWLNWAGWSPNSTAFNWKCCVFYCHFALLIHYFPIYYSKVHWHNLHLLKTLYIYISRVTFIHAFIVKNQNVITSLQWPLKLNKHSNALTNLIRSMGFLQHNKKMFPDAAAMPFACRFSVVSASERIDLRNYFYWILTLFNSMHLEEIDLPFGALVNRPKNLLTTA